MQQFGIVEVGGILVFAAFLVWLFVFFQFLRPRLMDRLGMNLGVAVHESTGVFDEGTYSTTGDAPLAKSAIVAVMDGAMLMLGTVGMAAAIFIPAFLIAESGAPYRWEGALTNTRVRLTTIEIPPMRDGTSAARLRVVNEGDRSQRACRAEVADYTARNGYLNGGSDYFDLAPAEDRIVPIALESLRPVVGRHTFRLALECDNRLKDKIVAAIDIVD
jgi:hypothetical protein